jgi:hypothetical protein
MKYQSLNGKKFGRWTVIRRVVSDRNGMTRFECLCECGNKSVVYSKHLKSGMSKSCGCGHPRGSSHKQWTGFHGLPGWYWNCIENHAKPKKKERKIIPLTITKQYIWELFVKQNSKCALTGIPLVMGLNCQKHLHTASLDRIDSSRGYVQGNVQWIHKDVNRMKGSFDQDYFISVCKQISQNQD